MQVFCLRIGLGKIFSVKEKEKYLSIKRRDMLVFLLYSILKERMRERDEREREEKILSMRQTSFAQR